MDYICITLKERETPKGKGATKWNLKYPKMTC